MESATPPESGPNRRQALIVGFTLVAGVAVALGSWLLREIDPWWSALLANIAVVAFLLVPGELVLTRIRSRFERVETVADQAQTAAETAQHTAEQTARSLEDVRRTIIDRQVAELDADLDVYRDIVRIPSRDSLLAALRKATAEEIVTRAGVRAPVWETEVHYRFVVDDTSAELSVHLEGDDGTVISSVIWEQNVSPEDFYQRLVYEVRQAGHDLGTALNDPTQSVQELSEMLVDVTRLRSQELAGHRSTLHRIIEKRDDWYFTEKSVIPAGNLQYRIGADTLNETDWEEHLRAKGWYTAPAAIEFARRLYGVPKQPSAPSSAEGSTRAADQDGEAE